MPENNQFNCEVCDRGFKTNEMYEIHCKTHTTVSFVYNAIIKKFLKLIFFSNFKCGVNGCKFTAAEKLVKIHFNNV